MKDFLGNELNEGDKVVCAVGHGRNSGASLSHGEIIRFTNKFAVVTCFDYTGRYKDERKIDPQKIIKR